jgi:hypothetical protein
VALLQKARTSGVLPTAPLSRTGRDSLLFTESMNRYFIRAALGTAGFVPEEVLEMSGPDCHVRVVPRQKLKSNSSYT